MARSPGCEIVEAGWAAVRGEFHTECEPGFCLRFVRQVVEHAFGWASHRFYRDYLVTRTTQGRPRSDWTPWAADLEASMKTLELAVPLQAARPGDLLFNYRAAQPYGHVGILMPHELVLENINPAYRPRSLCGQGKALTPLEAWPATLAARL